MLVVLVAGAFSGYPMGFVMAGIAVSFCLVADVPIAFLFTFVTRIYSGIPRRLAAALHPALRLHGPDARQVRHRRAAPDLAREAHGAPAGRLRHRRRGNRHHHGGLHGHCRRLHRHARLLGLPAMLERGYDPQIATGIIAASGTLGILIPPSIMLVVLGEVLQVSVGDLFLGALVPGILLGLLFIVWILIGAVLWPQRMPAIERREGIPLRALLLEAAPIWWRRSA